MSEYPEHDKLRSLQTERDIIQRFLDWLDEPEEHPQIARDGDRREEVRRIGKVWYIAEYPTCTHNAQGVLLDEADWFEWNDLVEVRPSKAHIVGMFLGVDPKKLEDEKQQMLEKIREDHERDDD